MSTAEALAEKTCPRCGATYDPEAVFCAKDGVRLDPDDGEEHGPDSDPYIGTVISGDIEILAVAGAGAMGRVYRAHQRGIDRDVAVKILHRDMSGNTQLVQRFHREAKIASKLQHPHVVEVFLAGQLPDKALFIVMEFLDGMSLAAALAGAGNVFPPGRALSIALQICDAVGEGHARGIVHRDLKPENVMLVRRAEMGDWAKVLDFGIAKVNLGEQSMETQAGLVFGTARYISPEGAQGAKVGPSGDVYSLAVMVYQMLAGRTPFDAEPLGLLIKHIHEPPPPITSWPRAADLPPGLARVIMDNLAKEPERRAQGARAFAAQLAGAAREAGITISEVGAVARMSSVDFGRAQAALDPTLDDASVQKLRSLEPPEPAVTQPSRIAEPIVSKTELLSVPAPSGDVAPATGNPTSGAVGSGAHGANAGDATAGTSEKRRSLTLVLVSLLLGAALTLIVTQYMGRRSDDEHSTHVKRARRALADARYVNPPGDNVREIVATGLAKFPDDLELAQVRAEAAHEMITRSLAARAGGDVGGARDLVHDALELDPSDHSARTLLGQYQQESDALGTDAGMFDGPPKVTFKTLPLAHPSQHMELTAQIAPGSAGPKAKLSGAKITLFENGKTTGGIAVPLTAAGVYGFHATLVTPKVGSYDVVFEAAVDGHPIHAQRDLDVLP